MFHFSLHTPVKLIKPPCQRPRGREVLSVPRKQKAKPAQRRKANEPVCLCVYARAGSGAIQPFLCPLPLPHLPRAQRLDLFTPSPRLYLRLCCFFFCFFLKKLSIPVDLFSVEVQCARRNHDLGKDRHLLQQTWGVVIVTVTHSQT